MTPKEQQLVYRQLTRKQARFEATWEPLIFAALRKQSLPAIRALESRGYEYTLSNLDALVQDDSIEAVLRRLYRTVGVESANDTYGYIQAAYGREMREQKGYDPRYQVKRFGFNQIWANVMNGIFSVFGARNVRSITDTERARLRRELIAGQEEGISNFELAKRLRSSQIWAKRARVISRTEPAIAASSGADMAAKRSGLLMKKVWLSARDNRTRRIPEDATDHYIMNNVEVMQDEPFLVPKIGGMDAMQHPHQPGSPANQVIQCRCKVIYIAARDSTGRLIRA